MSYIIRPGRRSGVRRTIFRHPTQIVVAAFALAVLIGTLLLMLPVSRAGEGHAPFTLALFTARQLGVQHVVRPEHDMGKRVGHLVRGRMIDYIEFDGGYAIVKATAPVSIRGLPLGECRVRSRHGVTIVGVKRAGEDFTHATPDTIVEDGDLIIVSGPEDKVEDFSDLL